MFEKTATSATIDYIAIATTTVCTNVAVFKKHWLLLLLFVLLMLTAAIFTAAITEHGQFGGGRSYQDKNNWFQLVEKLKTKSNEKKKSSVVIYFST